MGAIMLAAIPFPNISPELFTFEVGDFTFALRWYALAYIVGMLIGWRITARVLSLPRALARPSTDAARAGG